MSDTWYCKFEQRCCGPFTLEELRYLANRGRLSPRDVVKATAEAPWRPAESIDGLFVPPISPQVEIQQSVIMSARLLKPIPTARPEEPKDQPQPSVIAATSHPAAIMPPPRFSKTARLDRSILVGVSIGVVMLLLIFAILLWLTLSPYGLVFGRSGGSGGDISGDGNSGGEASASRAASSDAAGRSHNGSGANEENPESGAASGNTPPADGPPPKSSPPGSTDVNATKTPANKKSLPTSRTAESPPPKTNEPDPTALTISQIKSNPVESSEKANSGGRGATGGGRGGSFGGRGSGHRAALLASGGGTIESERAVAAALDWLARHQSSDGSWGLHNYSGRCADNSCSGAVRRSSRQGRTIRDRQAAATALAILPFLANGQTHKSKGKYLKTVADGIRFLIGHQKDDGDLRMGGDMYDHGLAALALNECYGMSNDKAVFRHAQAALTFIAAAQDSRGGGWRYAPGQAGDTSVVGWQVMALKSGQMARCAVPAIVFKRAKKFLASVATGDQNSGQFGYVPGVRAAGEATTAVGLLCHQYIGIERDTAPMRNGTAFLMQHLPKAGSRNVYYWYYATLVMHNQPGRDWDAWNSKMRQLLIETQCKKGFARGSWDPLTPTPDVYGIVGGRIMITSLSALTLEVYYQYLPLYQLKSGNSGETAKEGR